MTAIPTFGFVQPDVFYTERRAAYAVIVDGQARVAAVKGREKYFLPGGGSLPNEDAEETVLREVREELAQDARIVRTIGHAVQYFYAVPDDRYFRMHAVFFVAELTEALRGLPPGEHELFWLPGNEAEGAFFHTSHAWAVRDVLNTTQARVKAPTI